MKRPFVSVRGHHSRQSGSMSSTRCQQTDFPWPAAFPPPPPQPGHCRPGVVRQLLRYYAAVRLLSAIAHRRIPHGFPMHSASEDAEGAEISRFPCEMFSRVHGVSDRAEFATASPKRPQRCGLRHPLTASAPRLAHGSRHGTLISRLNTRPARTPVNASPTASRLCTHDSGPPWLAKLSTYDSFIHDISPVLTGAPEAQRNAREFLYPACGPGVREEAPFALL